MTTSRERSLHPQFARNASAVAFLIVLLFLHSSLLLAEGQACESTMMHVANTNIHQSREGLYKPLPDKRCTGKPVWVQQNTKPSSPNYIYFQSSAHAVSGWLIGTEVCATQGGLYSSGSTKCPCDRRLGGLWMEALRNSWIPNPRITVRCLSEGVPSSVGAEAADSLGVAMGVLVGVVFFIVLIAVIVCCCLASKMKSRSNRSINRVADAEQNISQINTISQEVFGTDRSAFHSVELHHPAPSVLLPPRYSLLNIQSLASAPPYDERDFTSDELPPPNYQDVIGTHGLTGDRVQEVVVLNRGQSVSDINVPSVEDGNGQAASNANGLNREESSGHRSPFFGEDLTMRRMEPQCS